jgi:hypothetical protein
LPGPGRASIIPPKFKTANGITPEPMTNMNALDDRSKGVLKSVIQIHIATG